MPASYRLLALRPGNARSLTALCTRDVLFTRSTVGKLATDLPYRVSAPDFHTAGLNRACGNAKTRGIFSLVYEPFEMTGSWCLSEYKKMSRSAAQLTRCWDFTGR